MPDENCYQAARHLARAATLVDLCQFLLVMPFDDATEREDAIDAYLEASNRDVIRGFAALKKDITEEELRDLTRARDEILHARSGPDRHNLLVTLGRYEELINILSLTEVAQCYASGVRPGRR